MVKKCKVKKPMTNAERSRKRRAKRAQDPERHAKAKAHDAERKRRARAGVNKSLGKSNEVKQLEKFYQEKL